MSAVWVGVGVDALTLVESGLDRALGPGTVRLALQELDPSASGLFGLMSANLRATRVERSFARLKSEEFSRGAFGQPRIPPSRPETSIALTTFVPVRESGFAPRHGEAEGLVEASRVVGGPAIEAVEWNGRRM